MLSLSLTPKKEGAAMRTLIAVFIGVSIVAVGAASFPSEASAQDALTPYTKDIFSQSIWNGASGPLVSGSVQAGSSISYDPKGFFTDLQPALSFPFKLTIGNLNTTVNGNHFGPGNGTVTDGLAGIITQTLDPINDGEKRFGPTWGLWESQTGPNPTADGLWGAFASGDPTSPVPVKGTNTYTGVTMWDATTTTGPIFCLHCSGTLTGNVDFKNKTASVSIFLDSTYGTLSATGTLAGNSFVLPMTGTLSGSGGTGTLSGALSGTVYGPKGEQVSGTFIGIISTGEGIGGSFGAEKP